MPKHDFSRRDFAAVVAGGAAGLTLGTNTSADEPKAATAFDVSAAPAVDLLLDLIRRVDPERLKSEHLEQLRGDVELNLRRSKTLSAFALTNADEPAPVFAAWRSEG